MDVLPLAVAAVPDARLLRLYGAGLPGRVDVLAQTDVGDARRLVPDQVHVGVEQDGVDGQLGPGQSCRTDTGREGLLAAAQHSFRSPC